MYVRLSESSKKPKQSATKKEGGGKQRQAMVEFNTLTIIKMQQNYKHDNDQKQ